MGILSPSFLTNNINIIGQIVSVMILVIFDDFISGRVILPGVDKLRDIVFQKAKEKIQKKQETKRFTKKIEILLAKYSAEFLATFLFISYFFAGYFILSEYIIVPILQRLQHIILLTTLACFLAISWVFNNKSLRKKFLDYSQT